MVALDLVIGRAVGGSRLVVELVSRGYARLGPQVSVLRACLDRS